MVIGQPATVTTAVFSLTLIISPLGIRQSHSVLVSSFSNWWNSLSTVSPIIHDYPRIILFSLSVSFSPRRVQSIKSQGLIIRTLLLSLPVHLLICFSFSLSLCQSLFNPHHCIPFDVVASTHFLSLRYRFFLFLRHSSQFCCCVREKHETQLSVVSDSNKFNSRSSNARCPPFTDRQFLWLTDHSLAKPVRTLEIAMSLYLYLSCTHTNDDADNEELFARTSTSRFIILSVRQQRDVVCPTNLTNYYNHAANWKCNNKLRRYSVVVQSRRETNLLAKCHLSPTDQLLRCELISTKTSPNESEWPAASQKCSFMISRRKTRSPSHNNTTKLIAIYKRRDHYHLK